MGKLIFAFGIIFSILTFVYCTKKSGKPPVVPVIDTCDTITYTKHIKGIITKKCIYCHDGKGPNANNPDYTLHDGLKAKILNGALKKRVIEIGRAHV